MLQFPEKYPTTAIIVELKSKTLPPRLLAKMTELCDQEAKTFLGKPQVGIVILLMVLNSGDGGGGCVGDGSNKNYMAVMTF